jgi:adenine-specific DNA methylase
VTDPPYFDSVQYSDLATFFRVWLHWFLPDAAQWHYEVSDSAVAETSSNGAKYESVLGGIWQECHRVLKKPGGRLVFTFHHWRAEAWAHLTLSLKRADFRLTNDFTVYSENPISVHIRQLNALKHDSILVFQPNGQYHPEKRYPAPPAVDASDSYQFCSDCASLLGFCLESDLNESQIWQLWKQSLGT